MRSNTLFTGLIGLLLGTFIQALPLSKRATTGPVITSDFPDPAILKVGNTWYAFGTQSFYDNRDIKVQLATSTDFTSWSLIQGKDALGSVPAWANQGDPQVWAPDVFQRDDGTFVLYFSAVPANALGKHCFGAATSQNVEGPYAPTSDDPIACPLDQGGAIDAASFRDSDGSRYITYKIDGNAVGHGGLCGNTVDPIVSTPIMLQRVEEDGFTLIGGPTQILDRGYYDGPLVEAPALVKAQDGTYILYFSSQCYTSDTYDTSYATASSITGPYTKATYPLLENFDGQNRYPFTGPGGADVTPDGTHMAFHGYASHGDIGNRRSMYVATVNFDAGSKVVTL